MRERVSAQVSSPLAFSVAAFCAAHGISRSLFYELQKAGRGPRILRVGRRVLITLEAAAEWREQLSKEA
jgi:predicted DNA-binding transcriptional regulator AlpA